MFYIHSIHVKSNVKYCYMILNTQIHYISYQIYVNILIILWTVFGHYVAHALNQLLSLPVPVFAPMILTVCLAATAAARAASRAATVVGLSQRASPNTTCRALGLLEH